jgi:hypothetical protein
LGYLIFNEAVHMKFLRETETDGANWFQLAQDRVQWRAFVSMVMNLPVPNRMQAAV